jgi:hypothetical protein
MKAGMEFITASDLHHGLGWDLLFSPYEAYGTGDVGGELGNAEVKVDFVAYLSEVTEFDRQVIEKEGAVKGNYRSGMDP